MKNKVRFLSGFEDSKHYYLCIIAICIFFVCGCSDSLNNALERESGQEAASQEQSLQEYEFKESVDMEVQLTQPETVSEIPV